MLMQASLWNKDRDSFLTEYVTNCKFLSKNTKVFPKKADIHNTKADYKERTLGYVKKDYYADK